MDDKNTVKTLIENDLYKYIQLIKENYNGKEAEKLINEYTHAFKETVLKKYTVEDIDGLIERTLSQINKAQERDDE